MKLADLQLVMFYFLYVQIIMLNLLGILFLGQKVVKEGAKLIITILREWERIRQVRKERKKRKRDPPT